MALLSDLSQEALKTFETGLKAAREKITDFGESMGPLESLYDDKYKQGFFQFPSNLESAEENHWVRFDIKEFLGGSLRPDKTRDLLTYKNNTDKKGTFLERAVKNTAEKSGTLIRGAARLPGRFVDSAAREILNDLPPGLGNLLGKKSFQKNRNKQRGLTTIMLYAPHIRQDSMKTNWSNKEVGQLGDVLSGGIFAGVKKTSDLLDTAIKEKIPLGSYAAGYALGAISNNSTLADVAIRSNSRAINNHLEIFFNGVDFRSYNFEFKLAPRNSHEAKTIKDIIEVFKYASAPALSVGGESGILFQYPNAFEIEFFNEKQTHRIAPSVLTSITVDHSGSGVNSTFYDGYPLETNLNLTFTEIEIMHKEKISKGY